MLTDVTRYYTVADSSDGRRWVEELSEYGMDLTSANAALIQERVLSGPIYVDVETAKLYRSLGYSVNEESFFKTLVEGVCTEGIDSDCDYVEIPNGRIMRYGEFKEFLFCKALENVDKLGCCLAEGFVKGVAAGTAYVKKPLACEWDSSKPRSCEWSECRVWNGRNTEAEV